MKISKKLKEYADTMTELTKNGMGYVENPDHLCNTLWIPIFSGNRTARINLNHNIEGFRGNGILWGSNGNCGTEYQIVELSDSWSGDAFQKMINKLAYNVARIMENKYGKNYGKYADIRSIKADARMPIILNELKKLG